MATLKLLLSQARRHSLSKPPFPPLPRSLSTSPNPIPNPNPNPNPEPTPIQSVSYAVKPKEPNQESPPTPPPTPQPRDSSNTETQSFWTREEIRYVKDVPTIKPVSYASRVAPLPEDKVEGKEEVKEKESEEMEMERKRIEAESRLRRRVFRVSEEEEGEKVKVPFPMLIKKKEKKEKVVPLDLAEAIRQVKANSKRNFDETIEAHVRLGIEKGRTDMVVRGSLILPHGDTKVVRVAFFAEGADADEARATGADIVGGVELIEEIASSRKLNVDKCFSTPQLALRLSKIASFLKERHLLPDRKQGTVTSDVSGAIKAARLGRIHFKMDKSSIVHVGLGKLSYTEESLRENMGAFVNALLLAKPAGLKKTSKYAGYVNSFHICSTMGPGFPVSVPSLSKAADHFNKAHLN